MVHDVPAERGASGVRLERIDADSFPAFRRAFGATFGHEPREEDLDRVLQVVDLERAVAARNERDEIVGTSGAYRFDLSLPGGRSVPCAGITVVSVRADHRRRGLLTRMMHQLIEDAVAREEPLAALWATESPIYGRYGFGPAVPTRDVKIERVHGGLHRTGPVEDVRIVDIEEAHEILPPLHEASRQQRGGLIARSEAWWRRILDDPEHRRGGGGPRQHAVLPGRGFVTYRLKDVWNDGAPNGTVEVEDLVALDGLAAAALWRFVLDTDLSGRVSATFRPPDDPLLAMLVDPQRADVHVGWPLYLRILDLEAAVAARWFAAEGGCVLAVTDGLVPANAGRWRLAVAGGAGKLERVDDLADADVDLHLDIEALATVFLGGVRTTQLRLAGLVHGSHEAAASLDRVLATDLAPNCDTMF